MLLLQYERIEILDQKYKWYELSKLEQQITSSDIHDLSDSL